LHKQGEFIFLDARPHSLRTGEAQHPRRFSRPGVVRPFLWGFGTNGDASVALQELVKSFLSTRKILMKQR
jgi:hypothetical protein